MKKKKRRSIRIRIVLSFLLLVVSVFSPLLSVRAEEPSEITIEASKTDDGGIIKDPMENLPEDSETDDMDGEELTETQPEDSETDDVDDEESAETQPEDPETDSEEEEPSEIVVQSSDDDGEGTGDDDISDYNDYVVDTKTLTKAVESEKNGITLSYSDDGTLTISGSGVALAWASNAIEEWLKEQGVQEGELTRIQFDGDCRFSGIMSNMFASKDPDDKFYDAVVEIDLTGLDTSEVTAMQGTFALCTNLVSLDVSKINTGNVVNMAGMFQLSANLKSLDLSSFNTGNVTDMGAMFQGCSNLESLNVSSFDTSQVDYIGGMFYECKGLISLDLSSFNTEKVSSMEYMFFGCENLKELNISGFDVSNVTAVNNMFDGCTSLEKINAPKTMGNVTVALPYTFYDETGKMYTELSSECEGKTLTKTFGGGSGDTEGNGDGGDGDDTGDTGNTGSDSGNAGDTGDTGSDSGNVGDTGNTGSNSGNAGDTGNTDINSGNAGDTGNTDSDSGNAGDTGSTGSNSESAGNNGSGSATQITGGNDGAEQFTSYLLPIQYTVVKGDMLIRIARRYGVSLDLVVAWNPQIKNPDLIYPGQVIIVGYTVVSIKTAETPVLEEAGTVVSEEDDYYIVKKGDCLYTIAKRNGVSFSSVLSLNPELVKQKYIYAGQKVRLR